MCFAHYLVKDIFVKVGHITLAGHWSIIIISKVLLKSHWVMWDTQDCTEVVGQNLKQMNKR